MTLALCGIAGFLRRSGDQTIQPETLARMGELLEHRGPDDDGLETLQDGAVGLAHRRLAILDLSPAGRQPMAYGNGRYRLVYNGEIYNFVELRRELKGRGWDFMTRCDSEVVLAAYAEWGSSCVDRFEGMWAFAIWDDQARTLFCSRDRFGIKPFYYFDDGKLFVFASEIRAVLASGVVPRKTDSDAVRLYLDAEVVDGVEGTFFQRVRRLPAGCSATVSERGLRIERYWCLPAMNRRAEIGIDPLERVRSCFEEAVRSHLVSDVDVGVSLSGGLDSSAIFAVASRSLSKAPRAFCAGYPNVSAYNEAHYAALVAERYEAQLELIRPSKTDLLATLPPMIWHLEEPPLPHGVYPRWRIAEAAGKDMKVLLVGQGGDEVFGGYQRHAWAALQDALLSLDTRTAYAVASALETQFVRARFYRWIRGLWRLSPIQAGADSARGPALRDMQGRFEPPGSMDQSRLNQVLRRDAEYAILPTLLKYDDKIGMAFSIECRVPFLDRRLVELASLLPPSEKIGRGWTKLIMRRAIEPYLPSTVCWRRSKMPYPTPFRVWLRGDLLAQARERILDGHLFEEGWLRRSPVEKQIERHHSGRVDLSGEIWKWLCLALWCEQRNRLTDRSYAVARIAGR